MADPVKLCKDCKYYNLRGSGADECRHPDHQRGVDPVRGDPLVTWCSTMRGTNTCGLEGKLWEAA
jgi:hypothetical protein